MSNCQNHAIITISQEKLSNQTLKSQKKLYREAKTHLLIRDVSLGFTFDDMLEKRVNFTFRR
jgi:hypothetical protein